MECTYKVYPEYLELRLVLINSTTTSSTLNGTTAVVHLHPELQELKHTISETSDGYNIRLYSDNPEDLVDYFIHHRDDIVRFAMVKMTSLKMEHFEPE